MRSVIDPELPRRTSCDAAGPRPVPDPVLPNDDVDPALFIVRLVCTSATEIGVVGRDRRAAPAADAASEALEA